MISDSFYYEELSEFLDNHQELSYLITCGIIILNVVVTIFNLITSASYFIQFVISSPVVFFVLSNAYWINIIANIMARQTYIISPFCMVINSAFIFYYPVGIYGVSRWNEVYTANWVGFLFLLN
jgi:hypothetical protein